MANLVDINCHFKYQPVITSSLVANNILTFSKQPSRLFSLLFLLPLRHASKPKKFPSSHQEWHSCGPIGRTPSFSFL